MTTILRRLGAAFPHGLAAGLLALGAGLGPAPAQALTTTTGCAAADSCTMTELMSGGAITVNGIEFSGFQSLGVTEWAPWTVEWDELTVSGQDLASGGRLMLRFSPLLDLAGPFMVAGSVAFDIAAPEGRALTLARLGMIDGDLTGGEGYADVRLNIFDAGGEQADLDLTLSEGSPITGPVSGGLPWMGTGVGVFGFALESLEPGVELSLGGANLSFQASPVPLPAAAPLALAGLAALGLIARSGRARP